MSCPVGRLLALVFVVTLGGVAACAPVPRAVRAGPAVRPDDPQAAEVEVEVESGIEALVEAHNRIRAEHDLPPLEHDPALSRAAEAHAVDMARNDFMAHEGSDDSTPSERITRQGYPWRTTGENVAEGHPTIDAVMDGWMDSPGHRKNILGDFAQVGVARATGEDGTPYWAVAFATPWPRREPAEAAVGLVEAINALRRDAGKPDLEVDPRLEAVAMAHARAAAGVGDAVPDPIRQVTANGYRYRTIGMAAASGQAETDEVLNSWSKKGGRRVDLLGDFRHVGAGYAADESGRPHWSLLLARPAAAR